MNSHKKFEHVKSFAYVGLVGWCEGGKSSRAEKNCVAGACFISMNHRRALYRINVIYFMSEKSAFHFDFLTLMKTMKAGEGRRIEFFSSSSSSL